MSGRPGRSGGTATDHRRPATTATLVGTALWRAAIVACALIGLLGTLAGRELGDALTELSQQASLGAALVYTALLVYPFVTGRRFHEPRTPWFRGAILVSVGRLRARAADSA